VDIYSKALVKPSLSTVVTPEVHALSMVLFSQHFKVVRPFTQALLRPQKCPLNMVEIHGAFPIIKWIGSPTLSSIYDAVKIGDTVYKV
jgi:hypothetical protein